MDDEKKRCGWVKNDPVYLAYHDTEWGVPVTDDPLLFEFLILEGAQAGLSWQTVLNRREGYRRAFAGFDAARVATFDEARVETLMQDSGIVRNRKKIESAIGNARSFLQIQREFGSFSAFAWAFVGGKPRVNRWKTAAEVPATTAESDALSKELKGRGFKFMGSTICYAHMQATGMVNDHTLDCFRYRELC